MTRSVSSNDRAALQPLARLKLDDAALKRLFAAIRRLDDAALLAALAPPAPAESPRRAATPVLAEVRARLAPLLAPAQEKADALAASMAAASGEPPLRARGLAAMVKALTRRYGADAVRAGAAKLMADIAAAAGRDAPP